MSADVKVGQVRRSRPYRVVEGQLAYVTDGGDPMPLGRVAAVWDNGYALLESCEDTSRSTVETVERVQEWWPLWPSEHEQYKDARGYEVKP